MINAYLEIRTEKAAFLIGLFDKIREYKRSKIEISGEDNTIIVKVEAYDEIALASTLQSFLKQFLIISKTNKLIK